MIKKGSDSSIKIIGAKNASSKSNGNVKVNFKFAKSTPLYNAAPTGKKSGGCSGCGQ